MPRVNLLKRIKTEGVWVLRSIPRKPSGGYDWTALPDGLYFVEWYEAGKRRRAKAGVTIAQARKHSAENATNWKGESWEYRDMTLPPTHLKLSL